MHTTRQTAKRLICPEAVQVWKQRTAMMRRAGASADSSV
jgi:hypothetical protein